MGKVEVFLHQDKSVSFQIVKGCVSFTSAGKERYLRSPPLLPAMKSHCGVYT